VWPSSLSQTHNISGAHAIFPIQGYPLYLSHTGVPPLSFPYRGTPSIVPMQGYPLYLSHTGAPPPLSLYRGSPLGKNCWLVVGYRHRCWLAEGYPLSQDQSTAPNSPALYNWLRPVWIQSLYFSSKKFTINNTKRFSKSFRLYFLKNPRGSSTSLNLMITTE